MYETIIEALKDFTEARERLKIAEDKWNNVLEQIRPAPNGAVFAALYFLKPEYVAEVAVEFYRVKRAYNQLGNSAEICRFLDERDAMRGRPQYGEPNIADMDPKI